MIAATAGATLRWYLAAASRTGRQVACAPLMPAQPRRESDCTEHRVSDCTDMMRVDCSVASLRIGSSEVCSMPNRRVMQRAKRDRREGKAATTQAGEFVREEIHHVRQGRHGARSPQQAIAIGLSKARRAGIELAPPAPGQTTAGARRRAQRDYARGHGAPRRQRATAKRRAATSRAIRRESHASASRRALAAQAHAAASRRGPARRAAAARRAVRTKGAARRSAAARKAARTRRHARDGA
jgi:hypothetical protein